ncbi:MAG: shikimate dehydrogenase [Bacteroidetes bacterium]|nr:shikimate dehydrogenase [Bacteroidota bacterium]
MDFPDVNTKVVAIIGNPIRHSLSPIIHNTAFQAQKLNYIYIAVDLVTKNLPKALEGIKALGFSGLNVTIPYKEAVLPYLESLSEVAQYTGAVNTIVCNNDHLYGDNTDVSGFLSPIQDLQLSGMPMTILGAGGAARAVAYALLREFNPQPLTIVARSVNQAQKIANDMDGLGHQVEVSDFETATAVIKKSRLIVNSTPVGMFPHVDETPWINGQIFSPDQVVYDLVYRPNKTRLLRQAELQGATIIGGLEMLIQQAAAAYRQWTNHEMPISIVRNTLMNKFCPK